MKPDRSLAILAAIFCLGLLLTPWWIGGNLPGVRTAALALVCLFSIVFAVFPRLIGTPTPLVLAPKAVAYGYLSSTETEATPVDRLMNG